MSRYAAMAREHWQKWLPDSYAAIQDPDKFFQDLAEEAGSQVEDLAEDLRGSAPPDEPFAAKMDRFARARQAAEEVVIKQILLPAPEPTSLATDDEDDEYQDAVSEFYQLSDQLQRGESDS